MPSVLYTTQWQCAIYWPKCVWWSDSLNARGRTTITTDVSAAETKRMQHVTDAADRTGSCLFIDLSAGWCICLLSHSGYWSSCRLVEQACYFVIYYLIAGLKRRALSHGQATCDWCLSRPPLFSVAFCPSAHPLTGWTQTRLQVTSRSMSIHTCV